MVGYPGSGKTTYAQKELSDHFRLDGDSLKTSDRVCRELRKQLQAGKSCVVDATNVTLERRAAAIAVAKEFNVPVRCILFEKSMEDSMEMADQRFKAGGPKIPKIAFYKLRKSFVLPSVEEGFSEINEV